MRSEKISVIVLLSAWSTGSTSVAGFLDRCGVYTCPPHQRTNDSCTPVAYEPLVYRDALAEYIDELSFTRKNDAKIFVDFFVNWIAEQKQNALENCCKHIALKHPLQTFMLPVIDRLVSPEYVMITRPYSDIEKTRQRRKWYPIYGKAGAKVIYDTANLYLQDNSKEYFSLPYAKFRTDRRLQRKLLRYLEISPGKEQLWAAEEWLK